MNSPDPVFTDADTRKSPSIEHKALISWVKSSGAAIDPHLAREAPERKALRAAAQGLLRAAQWADDQAAMNGGEAPSWQKDEAQRHAEAIKRLRGKV